MMRIYLLMLAVLVCCPIALAQTTSSGTVLGTVTDPSGAVIPGASVELTDTVTKVSRNAVTNEVGRYAFVGVQPGNYSVKAERTGFQPTRVPSVTVEVSRSYTVNLELQVGQSVQVVEVKALAGAELQTMDSTIGGALGGDTLLMLPTVARNVTSILTLQATSMPQQGPSQNSTLGGQVAGGRSDQNTIVLDGGNATNGVSGNTDYFVNFTGGQEAAIPTPIESIQEFRVSTSNHNASFSGASGSESVLVTKRGGNQYHGSAYYYGQNDALNANSWERNRLKQVRPPSRDNRFGAAFGGSIPKLPASAQTYFYFNYEGRRLITAQQISRLVPTDSLRQGILRFRDSAGNTISYDLLNSRQCGAQGNSACDPRGLGLSPVVKDLWSKLMPAGNDNSQGDGLNTTGFSAPLPLPNNSDFAVIRLDHAFSSNWQVMASYRYYKEVGNVSRQYDIGGLAAGKLGSPASTASIPRQPRYVVVGITGVITNTLTSETNVNYLRDYWNWATARAIPQVSGTEAALLIGGNSANGLVPINLNTTGARTRLWNGHNYGFRENLSWQKGSHLIRFGGTWNRSNVGFFRDDGQIGLVQPTYYVNQGSGINIAAAYRPPSCSASVTANCLPTSQNTNWNNYYTYALGIVDQALVVGARSGDLSALPPTSVLRANTTYSSFSFYGTDSWRLTPTLTLTYGLNWSVDVPPTEASGKQALSLTLDDNKPLVPQEYLARRRQAALQGQVYNPKIGFAPIGNTSLDYLYNIIYNTAAPRIALAWNPKGGSGFLGKLFGGGKTVLRGGYGQSFDRLNGVQKVGNALQGFGFQQTLTCLAPSRTGACLGTGGTDPSTAFRIGPDGSRVAIPALTATATPPLIPGTSAVAGANQAFANTTYQIDPSYRPGRNQQWNFTVQRELPGNGLLEFGYLARKAKNIYAPLEVNGVPYMMTLNGQTFAQAFNATAANIKAGGGIQPQPFFEKALAGSTFCAAPNANCTAGIVSRYSGNFTNQQVTTVWNNIQPSFTFGPATAATNQIATMFYWASAGWANYNAAFVTYRTRNYKGLTLDANFTYGHALDTRGLNQDFDTAASNSYDLHYDYGTSIFDRKYVLNMFGNYELPFARKGKGPLALIVQGWNLSPILSIYSGLPLKVLTGSTQEFGQGGSSNSGGAVLIAPSTFGNSVHSGVNGNPASGVATSGNAAAGGSGLNLFADPTAVYNSFRPALVGFDASSGAGGQLRGQNRWNLDLAISRRIRIGEKAVATLTGQFFNTFNHTQLGDPSVNLQSPNSFGVLSSQMNNPRVIQVGLHLAF